MPAAPRAEYLVALFVAIGWGAVVFAADGVLALTADREPIPAGVSPYYGLLALAAGGVVVWIALARVPLRPTPLPSALVAAAGVYLVLVASGFAGGLRLAVAQAASPFSLIAVAATAIGVIAFWAGMRAWRRSDGDRQRRRDGHGDMP